MNKKASSNPEEFNEIINLLEGAKKGKAVKPDQNFKTKLRDDLLNHALKPTHMPKEKDITFWKPWNITLVGVGSLAIVWLVIGATANLNNSTDLNKTESEVSTLNNEPIDSDDSESNELAFDNDNKASSKTHEDIKKDLQEDLSRINITPPPAEPGAESTNEETATEDNESEIISSQSGSIIFREIGDKKINTELNNIPEEDLDELIENVVEPVIKGYSSHGSDIVSLKVYGIKDGVTIRITYSTLNDPYEDADRHAQFPWLKDETGHYPVWDFYNN